MLLVQKTKQYTMAVRCERQIGAVNHKRGHSFHRYTILFWRYYVWALRGGTMGALMFPCLYCLLFQEFFYTACAIVIMEYIVQFCVVPRLR